jgi:hypothetical protein
MGAYIGINVYDMTHNEFLNINQSMNHNQEKYLRSPMETSCISDSKDHYVFPKYFEESNIGEPLSKSSLFLFPCLNSKHATHNESRSLELELVKIENHFQVICSRYTLLLNQIQEEKVVQ